MMQTEIINFLQVCKAKLISILNFLFGTMIFIKYLNKIWKKFYAINIIIVENNFSGLLNHGFFFFFCLFLVLYFKCIFLWNSVWCFQIFNNNGRATLLPIFLYKFFNRRFKVHWSSTTDQSSQGKTVSVNIKWRSSGLAKLSRDIFPLNFNQESLILDNKEKF